MPTSYEVIVIGGGAIGAACARELARTGRNVLVLDKGTRDGEAWRAAAGMLAPQIEAQQDDPLYSLALAGRNRYAALSEELKSATGVDIRYWQPGILRLATSESEAGPLQDRVAWQQQRGDRAEWLSREEVAARWPSVGDCQGALWAPDEAAVDPALLVQGLLADARRQGGQVLKERALRIVSNRGRVTGVECESATFTAEHCVVAAGSWSGMLDGLPRRMPVDPIKGQMLAYPWPEGVEPGIVFGEHAYIVRRGEEAIVGSTMESVGFDPKVTTEGLSRIRTAAIALVPALEALPMKRSWAGLRPCTRDGRPIIGPEPRLQGLWYATGHGRNGILLAAITGQLLTQLISGEDPVKDLFPLRPERFRDS